MTSSVTLKVLGTARNAGLVIFSFVFLQEVVTSLQGVGYTMSLVAFGFYNYFKMSQVAPAAHKTNIEPVCGGACWCCFLHREYIMCVAGQLSELFRCVNLPSMVWYILRASLDAHVHKPSDKEATLMCPMVR